MPIKHCDSPKKPWSTRIQTERGRALRSLRPILGPAVAVVSGRLAQVAMMQAADLWQFDHLPLLR